MAKMVQIDGQVRDVLSRATMTASTVVLPELIERALYTKVDKVLKAAGGKWDRKAKAHVFKTGDPRIILRAGDEVAAAVMNRQQALQQFFTPPEIAERMVQFADVLPEHDCLEPSAGHGALADALRSAGVWQPQLVEIDELCVDVLRRKGYERILHCDFMTLDAPMMSGHKLGFDRIVMNSPFSNAQDIRHVTHAFSMLRPNGVLVAIVSPSIEFRSSRAHEQFRHLLSDFGIIVERLPPGTFDDTSVETSIVRLCR